MTQQRKMTQQRQSRKRKREEAAPTFPTWKQQLEEKEQTLRTEVEQLLVTLKAIGAPMIEGPAVHFVYYNPAAQHVALTGEFIQWDPRGIPLTPLGRTGIFYHSAEFGGPARIEYKFIVDGQWIVDPFCPTQVDTGIGEQNSCFIVGDFRESPEFEWMDAIPHGRIEEFDFGSALLHNQRRIYVYLPPGYDEDLAYRFPSLYVHDGGEYISRAQFPIILDNLLHNQAISPLIAVMVDPVDRLSEYRINEQYAHFIEHELLPHIDGRYRTLAQREARGVMGASMGGLSATYLALSRPHLFSKVGGQSSAFFLEQEYIAALIGQLVETVTFYFDVGQYEQQFVPAHHQLVALLHAKGCPCFFQEAPAGHDWASWRAHLKDLLTFLWKQEGRVEQTRVAAQ